MLIFVSLFIKIEKIKGAEEKANVERNSKPILPKVIFVEMFMILGGQAPQ